jgi:ribonucleotide reductase alpha subunit
LIKIKNEELNDKIYKLFTLLSSLFIVVLSSINLVLVNNDAFNGKTFDTSDWGVLVCDIMLGIIFFVNLIFLIKFIIKKIMKKDSKTK